MTRKSLPSILAILTLLSSFSLYAAEWKVERDAQGVPRIFKDGEAVEPWIYCFARAVPGRDNEHKAVTDGIRFARKAGMHIYSVMMEPDWSDGETRNAEYADHVMKLILDNDPDAYVMPRVTMESWWIWHDLYNRNLSAHGRRDDVAICSPRYRTAAKEAVRRFVRRMEARYADHLFGYQVCAGQHGEFQHMQFGEQGNYLGYDESTKAVFRAKTGLEVPSPIRRSGEMGKVFYDQNRDADIIAFNRLMSEEMADHLLEMARVVREECGKTRIVAAFYGYVFECYAQRVGPSQSGHYALSKVLASPDVDVLCGPHSYCDDSRCPGGPTTTHTAGESVTAHGKIWMNEDDTATHISMKNREPEDDTTRTGWNRSLDETKMLVRRNSAFSLARNYGAWWFDHHSHGMWNDPELWKERVRFARLYNALEPAPYSADVRYVFSERMTDYCIANVPVHFVLQEGAFFGRPLVARSACATDTVLLEDLANVPPAKLEIHANTVALTGEQRRALRRRAEKTPTIWLWTPGLIDLDSGKESLAAVEELTGFKVEAVSPPTYAVFRRADGADCMLPITWGYSKTQGTVLSPVLEKGDTLLAVWRDDTWRPAAVFRPAKDGKAFSVFCGTPSIPSSGIRHFAQMAGAKVRCSRDAAVDIRPGMAAITVGEGGLYDLNVDGDGEWFDMITGKSAGRAPRLHLDMAPQSTRILLDSATMARYRRGEEGKGKRKETRGWTLDKPGSEAPTMDELAARARSATLGAPANPVPLIKRPPILCFVNRPVKRTSLEHGYIYPFTYASVTYVADVTIDALPQGENGAICGRSGWDNAIEVRPDGSLMFTCFSIDGKRSGDVYSKVKLVPGREYRVAGVVDCSFGNETRLRLYVDGELQGEVVAFEGGPWNHPWKIWIGQMEGPGGKPRIPLDCTVRNFWYFHGPLSKEEIDAL